MDEMDELWRSVNHIFLIAVASGPEELLYSALIE